MNIKIFQLFWLDGNSKIIKGTCISEAFMRAGYGNGALKALDYYREVEEYAND